ncbi:MAG: cytochrome P460 family protein [Gammaproteobacteria bacterium]
MSKQRPGYVRSLALLIVLAAAPATPADDDDDPSFHAEMSGISGTADRPRRHFRLKYPRQLDPERAASIYELVADTLAKGYASSGLTAIAGYQSWTRYNASPYLSATHGNHYLNNYVNATGAAYGRFEEAGTLPPGTVIAKDSFSVTSTGGILLGPLAVMEKMPAGFSPSTGDWKYIEVLPDGELLGETNGRHAERVDYCIDCHLAVEAQDHLFFVPRALRANIQR